MDLRLQLTDLQLWRLLMPYLGNELIILGFDEHPVIFSDPSDLCNAGAGGAFNPKTDIVLKLKSLEAMRDTELSILASMAVGPKIRSLGNRWDVRRIYDGVGRIVSFEMRLIVGKIPCDSYRVTFDISNDLEITYFEAGKDKGNYDSWAWYGKLAEWGYDRPVYIQYNHPFNGKKMSDLGLAVLPEPAIS